MSHEFALNFNPNNPYCQGEDASLLIFHSEGLVFEVFIPFITVKTNKQTKQKQQTTDAVWRHPATYVSSPECENLSMQTCRLSLLVKLQVKRAGTCGVLSIRKHLCTVWVIEHRSTLPRGFQDIGDLQKPWAWGTGCRWPCWRRGFGLKLSLPAILSVCWNFCCCLLVIPCYVTGLC